MNPLTQFGDYTKSVFTTLLKAKGGADPVVEDYIQKDDAGLTEYSSVGPGYNEVTTTYQYGTGAHHIRFLNLISPDIILVHQSKMVGFYAVLRSPDELSVVQRDVKNLLVKDAYITL